MASPPPRNNSTRECSNATSADEGRLSAVSVGEGEGYGTSYSAGSTGTPALAKKISMMSLHSSEVVALEMWRRSSWTSSFERPTAGLVDCGVVSSVVALRAVWMDGGGVGLGRAFVSATGSGVLGAENLGGSLAASAFLALALSGTREFGALGYPLSATIDLEVPMGVGGAEDRLEVSKS